MNISEGRRLEVVAELAGLAEVDLLDVHADAHHHRSVLTLAGTTAARHVARQAVHLLDLRQHDGVHPRLGVVDVVPFVPIPDSTLGDAVRARDEFARWAVDELNVPCFLYGPERSLPEVRRRAWTDLAPDLGPDHPHPTAGAICVGARDALVAYNIWISGTDDVGARRIASMVRGDSLRSLGLVVGDRLQVSMNLIAPDVVGPMVAFDRVNEAAKSQGARVDGAELVGLLPARCLAAIPRDRWTELDLSPEQTLEWQLAQRNRRGAERS